MRRLAWMLGVVLALWVGGAQPASAQTTLWYGGDPQGLNTYNSLYSGGGTRIFDDFTVNDSGGWRISSLWNHGLAFGDFTHAEWSIRTGMSAGNGGTIVAEGVRPVAVSSVSLGTGTFAKVQVSDLDIVLAPGTYWMHLTPLVSSGAHYVGETFGANGINLSPANNGNAFEDITTSETRYGAKDTNYSMGLTGLRLDDETSAVPEPGALVLFLPALGVVAVLKRRRTG